MPAACPGSPERDVRLPCQATSAVEHHKHGRLPRPNRPEAGGGGGNGPGGDDSTEATSSRTPHQGEQHLRTRADVATPNFTRGTRPGQTQNGTNSGGLFASHGASSSVGICSSFAHDHMMASGLGSLAVGTVVANTSPVGRISIDFRMCE